MGYYMDYIIYTVIIIFIFLYKNKLAFKLPKKIEKLFDYKILRFIFIFLLCKIKFNILAHISILISLFFILI